MKKLALLFHLILVLFLTGTQLTFAQSFPVQVIPQALPPAPIYFSDYADESTVTSPLRVQLILNDLQVASKEVRLKASFEGNGIAFESNAIVSGAPLLFLESGIPLNLTNVELAPYFRFENIVGISPNVYGQPIPEGTYRFCFEVFDAFSGNRISDRTCAGTVIFQNDPPILISPLNKAIVEERNPQNIVFQWTPRHINVSNVEYELSIVEIWDNQIDHQAAFLSSPPIFQTTTQATAYLYGPADPQLLSDKNYAWRVQAKAKQGTEEIGLFKNQGYSTIFVFGNTSVCDLPIGINHEVKGATNANIFWEDFSSEAAEFQVRYRETGGNKEWFYSKTTANLLTVWELAPGTEYEYQIAKTCALSESEYSIVKTFRTNLFDTDDSIYECGIAPDINVTNETPLASLSAGEKFNAGDFPVTILEVDGANGYFTGKGYVTIPYLKSFKVAVEFTNILINENKELAQGNLITAYDPTLSNIIDPGDTLDDIGDIIFGGDTHQLDEVDFAIENARVSEDGEELIISGKDEQGNPQEVRVPYDEADSYRINGTNGGYEVGPDGIDKLGDIADGGTPDTGNTGGLSSSGDGTASDPSVATWADNDVTVRFYTNSKTTYGFDEATSAYEKEKYPKVNLESGGQENPVHKAVLDGVTDTFLADITINNSDIKKEDLVFKTINGIKLEAVNISGDTYEITLKGGNGYSNEEALITYKKADGTQVVVSSFFMHHLKQLEPVNVVLVEVDGYSIPNSSKDNIAGYFTNSGANISIDKETYGSSLSSSLQYNSSGLLSNHPESFKKFYQEFKNTHSNYSDNTYYVFAFDDTVQPGNNLGGFMPRGSQFGFIFSSNINPNGFESKGSLDAIIGHEIAHGVFDLKHPFEAGQGPAGTDWLIDYGNGTELSQENWKSLGYEGIRLYFFDKDEDGENVTADGFFRDYGFLTGGYGNKTQTFPFLTPTNEVILLPNEVMNVEFFFGYYGGDFDTNNEAGREGNIKQFSKLIPGTIRAFEIDLDFKRFEAKFEPNADGIPIFKGYVTESGEQYDWENYRKYNEEGKDLGPQENTDYAIMLLPKDYGGFVLHKLNKRGKENDYKILDKPIINVADVDFEFTEYGNPYTKWDSDGILYNNNTNKSELLNSLKWVKRNGTDKESYILLTKIAEIRSVFPEYIDYVTSNDFGNWRFPSDYYFYQRSGSFKSYLNKKFYDCEELTSPGGLVGQTLLCKRTSVPYLPDTRVEFLKEFMQFLASELTEEETEIVDLLKRINKDNTVAAKCDFKKLIRALNLASKENIQVLTGDAAVYIISRLADEGLFQRSNIVSDGETAALKLIENINHNATVAGTFIRGLESPNKVREINNQSTKYVYKQIFEKVDNNFLGFGEDNRLRLIVAFSKLVFYTDDYEKRIEELASDFENRSFILEYQNIVKRGAIEILKSNPTLLPLRMVNNDFFNEKIENPYLAIDVDYDSERGVFDGKQVTKSGFSWPVIQFESKQLKPFDLVYFANKSNLSSLKQLSKLNVEAGDLPMPAIILMYADREGSNQTIKDGIFTAIDIATIFSGPGALAKIPSGAAKLRKAVIAADIASSITGIAATGTSDTQSAVNKGLTLTSNILGILSLGGEGALKVNDELFSVKNIFDNPTISDVPNVNDIINDLEELEKKSGNLEKFASIDNFFIKTTYYLRRMSSEVGNASTSLKKRLDDFRERLRLARKISNTAGKIIRNEDNLLDISSIAGEFKQFTILKSDKTFKRILRAGTFWNKTANPNIIQYISKDGKFYLKLDPNINDRRLLFFDLENNKCIGWGLLPLNKTGADLARKLDTADDLENLISDLKLIHGFDLSQTAFNFNNKGTLIRSTNKTNAYLGSYNPSKILPNELGTSDILDKLNIYKHYAFNENSKFLRAGSLLMLNVPDEIIKSNSTFFRDFNKDFMDFIIENIDKTEIVLATRPNKELFKAWKNGRVLRNQNGLIEPSGFAKEIKYLIENGITNVKFKDGSIINLNDVDFGEDLDWITNWKF